MSAPDTDRKSEPVWAFLCVWAAGMCVVLTCVAVTHADWDVARGSTVVMVAFLALAALLESVKRRV